MAGTVNKVILVGRLGADPEVRYTAGGTAMANVSLATNSRRKDPQTDQWVEQTEWHRVVLFQRNAEVAGEYLRKGRLVYIEGRLQTRKWQDQNGQDRWTTEVVGNEMQMLGGRDDMQGGDFSGGGGQSYSAPAAAPSGPPPSSAPSPAPSGNMPPASDFDDDIPF